MVDKMTKVARQGALFVIFATVVSFLISLSGSSLKSTVQVLFLPIADGFEVSRGTLAIATTVFAVVTALASSGVGYLADRIGPVPVLALGTGITGGVFLLGSYVDTIWLFIVVYGVIGAVGFTMLSFVPLGVLAAQLFQGRNAGLLYAVLTNGAAVGFMVLVPLWAQLAETMPWQRIFAGVGIFFLVVLLPLSLVLLRFSNRSTPAAKTGPSFWQGVGETFRNRQVSMLIIAFFACGGTMAFIDVHLFPHMHDQGVSTGISSLSLIALGGLEIVGSLVTGRLCDRGAIRSTLVGAYLLRAASMVLLFFFSSAAMVVLFGAMFGASYLATVVATTIWITKIVPQGSRGTVIGVLWAIHMIGVALSSQLGAVLADAQGGYTLTILLSIVLTTGAAFLVGALPDPTRAGGAPEGAVPVDPDGPSDLEQAPATAAGAAGKSADAPR